MKSQRILTQNGSVLITVIWILGLLSVFTLAINRRVSQELFAGKWMKESVMARSFAKAGIERALYEIQADEFITFDALNQPWASNEEAFNEVRMQSGSFTVTCDSMPKEGELLTTPIRYGACDESARININTADEMTLIELLDLTTELDEKKAGDVAHAIIDWRDEDDAEMLQGAERNYYKALRNPYEPRNADFESIEELQMVKGVTEEIYMAIKDYVTVYTDEKVNFNTAGQIVLQALGLHEGLAQEVISFRAGEDGVPGTEDDGVFQAEEAITSSLTAGSSMSSEDFAVISNLISEGKIGVKSDAFRIRSIGRFINSGVDELGTGVVCVLDREGTIFYWWEGAI